MNNPTGVELIAAERDRQVKQEGWSPEHDDHHLPGTLTMAAMCYASFAGSSPIMRNMIRSATIDQGIAPRGWPWELAWWKPGIDDSNESRIRELTKAGALIAAEIDRLQRKLVIQKSTPPWTDEQVTALNELQTGIRYGHPYTCPNRGDGKHRHNGRDTGCLVATPDGWICPDCDYTQNWAHESSMDLPKWEDMNPYLRENQHIDAGNSSHTGLNRCPTCNAPMSYQDDRSEDGQSIVMAWYECPDCEYREEAPI